MANVDKEKGEMMNENFVKVYEIMESDKLEIVMQLGGQKRTVRFYVVISENLFMCCGAFIRNYRTIIRFF